jgi:hypothetical protein
LAAFWPQDNSVLEYELHDILGLAGDVSDLQAAASSANARLERLEDELTDLPRASAHLRLGSDLPSQLERQNRIGRPHFTILCFASEFSDIASDRYSHSQKVVSSVRTLHDSLEYEFSSLSRIRMLPKVASIPQDTMVNTLTSTPSHRKIFALSSEVNPGMN